MVPQELQARDAGMRSSDRPCGIYGRCHQKSTFSIMGHSGRTTGCVACQRNSQEEDTRALMMDVFRRDYGTQDLGTIG